MRITFPSKKIWAWAFYDWANSAFATTVLAALFPVFFKKYWSVGASAVESTAQLGVSHSLASATLALFSPMLGAIADRGQSKRKFLFTFTFLGILGTSCLFLVPMGQWPIAVLLFIIGNIGFAGSNIFYDALLVVISDKRDFEFNSAFGFSLGYLGGGLLFLLNVFMIQFPETFGIPSVEMATRLSFLSVGIWWLVFSIPLFLFVNEREMGAAKNEKAKGLSAQKIIKESIAQAIATLKDIYGKKDLMFFLLAYFFYIDGLNTIMKMAVDYGMAIGLDSKGLITAILLVQFVGFPATLVVNMISKKRGFKVALYFCITAYLFSTVWAYYMKSTWEFFVLATIIAFVQGGTQSISRGIFARMIPHHKAGEYFGFFNMLGKFSSVLGPLLIGAVGYFTESSRLSILSIAVLFIVGLYFLTKVEWREEQVD